jgi:hypothetical protein
MMLVMLVVGIACFLVGLLAIGFGIPVQEFSFGNTLILAGAIAGCTGLVILSLWVVLREMKNIAQRLGLAETLDETTPQPTVVTTRHQSPEGGGFLFSRDQSATERAESGPAPWQDEAAARSARGDAPPVQAPEETPPAAKPRRNLLFSSTSRRERERAQARAADPSTADLRPAPATPPVPEIGEAPPATFEDAWPKPDRARPAEAPPQRRSGRAPSTFSEPPVGAAGADRPPPVADQPPVTVLKSGVVDGMAYSLYSDGSIEAQMPEGMMRFASIDELRAHLDHRP